MSETIEQALATLRALHPKKIDLGLERIQFVLKALGNPEQNLPPIIHVAGTNGKGSTIANLKAIAQAANLKPHVYTSPHLVAFNERIVVSGEQVSDGILIDALQRVRDANAGAPLSFFEATTAAAYLIFSEAPADVVIVEVGLGGRYDATNVIVPACCAITSIDYDHAEFLGRDLAGIAREKAGIMKAHTPVLCGAQNDLVNAVLESEAQKTKSKIKFWGQDFRAYRQHGRMVFEQGDEVLDLPLPALRGEHQVLNSGLAVAVARQMKWPIDAIVAGLQSTTWPARLQNLTKGRYAEMAHDAEAELWLDGGHNPHAARAIASAMAELEQVTERPLILITGILANKDVGGFLDAFNGLASAVIGINIPNHESLAPETLKELASTRNMQGYVADHVMEAIQTALQIGEAISEESEGQALAAPRILICGSLYLAGEVLKP